MTKNAPRLLLLATMMLAAFAAQAQSGTAPANPAKTVLVTRVLQQQQPAIEAVARKLAEQPAASLMEAAGAALPSRVAVDKRDAVARDIRADVNAYLAEAVPLVKARAVNLAPSTVGAVLEAKFTEEELTQLVAALESPAYAKFQSMMGEMQNVLVTKLEEDTRPNIEPLAKTLDNSIAKRLGMTEAPVAAAKPAAKPKATPKPAAN